jgi:hypothetical protein
MDCLPRISVERVKKEHGVGDKISTTTTCPYITQFRYGLLAKNLGEKGKEGTFD